MRAWVAVALVGCPSVQLPDIPRDTAVEADTDVDADSDADADVDTDADSDTDADADADADTDPPCALGRACNPIPIPSFPYADSRDTSAPAESAVDAYACDPTVDESGGEFWYTFTLAEEGRIVATIDEVTGDGVDVDVHLLSAPDPAACLERGHASVDAQLGPGTYFLALDTWSGPSYAGPYTLTVAFAPGGVDCGYAPTDVRMFWPSCDPGVADCFVSGGDVWLSTPTIGPVVMEAHLVTVEDDFGGGWPSSPTDGLADHIAASEAATGYAYPRTEPWAPAGEGGSNYGQGSTGGPIPVEDEAWYITMYWRDRPAGGTRMIVRNPANGRAVVAAAGWETGPGSNTRVAGVVEEVHHWLGSAHASELEIGFASDQTLPLGPVDCP